MKIIMARIVSVLILFISVTAKATDNDEAEYEPLREPDCEPLKVLVELPIPAEAGYTFEPTHALVPRCMGVNNEKKACVYTKARMKHGKVVKVQKMAQENVFLYLSWVSHEDCKYQDRKCPLEDARKCHKNSTTHYYDERECTCTHFVRIHEDISSVRMSNLPPAEVQTITSLTATPEGIITTDTIPEGTDNNVVSQITYTQQPTTTTIDSSEVQTQEPVTINFIMTTPPSNTKGTHSETSNIINDIPVNNVGTTTNIVNDTPVSNISTTINIIDNTPISNIGTSRNNIINDAHVTNVGTTSSIIKNVPISNTGIIDNLTSKIINDVPVRYIGTTNNIINEAPINNVGTNDHLIIIPPVKNKNIICISYDQYVALVVLAILLLAFMVLLGLYAFFRKKRHMRQHSAKHKPYQKSKNLPNRRSYRLSEEQDFCRTNLFHI